MPLKKETKKKIRPTGKCRQIAGNYNEYKLKRALSMVFKPDINLVHLFGC